MSVRNQVIMSQVMLSNQSNVFGKVHGGEIMKIMDMAAGVAAMKYAKSGCVTVRVDEMEFHLPINIGDLVTATASVVSVGNTSLEVFVTLETEDITKEEESKHALSAYFTMVCIDQEGRPHPVKKYTPETEEEIQLYEEVQKRKSVRSSFK